jgi:hypothetical protein
MRVGKLRIGFWILLLSVCTAGGAVLIWEHTHMLYPAPENESAFLQHYTPEHVISRFQAKESSNSGHHASSSAGRKYVSREAGFECNFAMSSDKWMALMEALDEDASQQLAASGAQILDHSGDPRNGFRFDYKAGHVIGSLTILQLAPSGFHRVAPLPAGVAYVTARIEQTELWFPKEPGTIQISVTDRSR